MKEETLQTLRQQRFDIVAEERQIRYGDTDIESEEKLEALNQEKIANLENSKEAVAGLRQITEEIASIEFELRSINENISRLQDDINVLNRRLGQA